MLATRRSLWQVPCPGWRHEKRPTIWKSCQANMPPPYGDPAWAAGKVRGFGGDGLQTENTEETPEETNVFRQTRCIYGSVDGIIRSLWRKFPHILYLHAFTCHGYRPFSVNVQEVLLLPFR